MSDDTPTVLPPDATLAVTEEQITPLFSRALAGVRDEIRENPYIAEALRVLPVRGYRSAIGNFWNAVVDDLRNKAIHRSLALFNKSVKLSRDIKTYEDFQNFVNDDELIEGSYKIGVIGYEASKILKHCKETRHFFDGHPKSTEPSIIKVLAMMDDCIKYVLAAPYPAQIIDIDDYLKVMNTADFDRNAFAIEVAISELPEIYKSELAHRLFTVYIHPTASSVLRSNIEYVAPILWPFLPKSVQIEIVRRVDKEFLKGSSPTTEQAFAFVNIVGASSYLSPAARRYKIAPLVEQLEKNLDNFKIETETVKELIPWAAVIPPETVEQYVSAMTHTYVGHIGFSLQFARTNFYSDGAAQHIPKMFELFDDRAAEAFVKTIRSSSTLRSRIQNPSKLQRLRALAQIVLGRISPTFTEKDFLLTLVDPAQEGRFFEEMKSERPSAKR